MGGQLGWGTCHDDHHRDIDGNDHHRDGDGNNRNNDFWG
jgi:hypothetical protein